MNTELTILYTSEYNYKASNEFVLKGQFTESEFKQLRALDEFFVPSELGLPNPAIELISEDGDNDEHHGFCSLPDSEHYDFDAFTKATATSKAPTIQMTPQQFIDAHKASPKDAGAEIWKLLT